MQRPTTRISTRTSIGAAALCGIFLGGVLASTAAAAGHWSFEPLDRPSLPEVSDEPWPRTDIDRFILARMEKEGLTPVADADRRTLVRRAYFALVGLPPAPADTDAFLADESPDAFERLVDRLLASPHFGERWGRHWLDVARFAQSTGGGRSMLYGSAWRYRDYVIRSLNEDKPFDRFIVEQIAGDLLPQDAVSMQQARDRLIGTAFLALGPTNYELQDKEQLTMDVIDEQIDTVGRAFLGMTLGCARCHDHKFDPVPTTDYYALAGIFRSTKTLVHANVSEWIKRPLPDDRLAALEREIESLTDSLRSREAKLATLREELGLGDAIAIDDEAEGVELVGGWTQSSGVKPFVGEAYRYANGADARAVYRFDLDKPGRFEVSVSYAPHANRTPTARIAIEHAGGTDEREIDQRKAPSAGAFEPLGSFELDGQVAVTISNAASTGAVIADAVRLVPVPAASSERLSSLESKIAELKAELAVQEKARTEATVLTISVEEVAAPGDYRVCVRGNVHELGEMVPRGFLSAVDVDEEREYEIEPGESGRLELARWIASDENPLAARVIVNRVWHHLFGTGLVRTVDNFGTTGEQPSHPELLDYLAVEFVEDGWRIKPLIRRIMLSRTWQLSSQVPQSKDPENRLLSRHNVRRLDAESLYDSILALSGRLDLTIGGPTVREGTNSEYGYEFDVGRRAIYLPVFRNRLHELSAAFDFPDPNLSIGQRNTSTLATQALYLMNNPFVLDQAAAAADRLLAEPLEDDARITLLYERALGRPPSDVEHQLARTFLANADETHADAHHARWTQLCQAVIGCIDFRYVR